MTWHDSAMFHVREWARRQFRTGYGGMDFSTRFGKPGNDPFRGQIRSAWVWSVGWPLILILGVILGTTFGGWVAGLAVSVVLGLAFPSRADGPGSPLAESLPSGWRLTDGRSLWRLHRAGQAVPGRGAPPLPPRIHLEPARHARLIEYKGQAARV